MKTVYYIENKINAVISGGYLCKDGKFRIGVFSGQPKYDTLVYKSFGHAWNRYKKVKKKYPEAVLTETYRLA